MRRRQGLDRPSVAATTSVGRLLLSVAAVLAVIAVVAVSSGLRTHPEHRTRVIHLPPDRITPLDAAGCPVGSRCQVRSDEPTALSAAVRQNFPRAQLQWHSTTSVIGGAVSRITAQYLLNGDQDSLLVNAECEPGAAQPSQRRESNSAQQRSDLAGNQISELAVHEIVSPGAAGCTADLILSAIGDGFHYNDGLQALSRDPAIQVRA